MENWREGNKTFIGLDWGNTRDPMCVSIVDDDGYEVYREYYRGDFASYVRKIHELHFQYQTSAIVAERNSIGGVAVEALQAEGLPVHDIAINKDVKTRMFDMLRLSLQNNELQLIKPTLDESESIAVAMANWGRKAFGAGAIKFV